MELLPGTGYAHMQGYLGLFAVRGGQFALAFQQPVEERLPIDGMGQRLANAEVQEPTWVGELGFHLELVPADLRLAQ